jgi:hypothetical protein
MEEFQTWLARREEWRQGRRVFCTGLALSIVGNAIAWASGLIWHYLTGHFTWSG